MNYRVEYTNQNWDAADIDADSPLEAAELYLRQDAHKRWQDYDEVVVFWGRFGKERQTFPLRDLAKASGLVGGETVTSNIPPPATTSPQVTASGETQPGASDGAPQDRSSFGGQLVGVVVLLLVIFGFIMFQDWNSPAGKGNYDKVTVGMSLAEVEQILGTLSGVPSYARAKFTGTGKWMSSGAGNILGVTGRQGRNEITIEFRNGVVVRKSRQ